MFHFFAPPCIASFIVLSIFLLPRDAYIIPKRILLADFAFDRNQNGGDHHFDFCLKV